MLSNMFNNMFSSWKVDIQCGLKNNVFFPGNVVEGVVTINTTAQINFTAIRLKICGKEKVHIQRPGQNGNKHHYFASNVVLKQLITLVGDLKYNTYSKGNYQLPPGRYSYPFAFQLPPDLPPSFLRRITDDTASIIYYVKAYVDIPMARDAVYKSFFTVIRPVPALQWAQRLPVGIDRQFQVTLCCCISKGMVRSHMSMDRTIIAMDRDWLQVFANIDNSMGEEPVLNLEVSLRHTLRYIARGVVETHTYTAGKRFIGTSVPARQRGLVSGVIDLPRNLIPSFMTPNIHSQYVITIELNIPWASDPCVAVPVFIAQSVDEANFTPPVSFDAVGGTRFTAGRSPCTEYYYTPPPYPVYPLNPAPIPRPPNALFLPPPVVANHFLPSAQWVQGNQPPPPVGPPSQQMFQWQQGCNQVAAQHYVMPPPPSEPCIAPPPAPNQNQNQHYKDAPAQSTEVGYPPVKAAAEGGTSPAPTTTTHVGYGSPPPHQQQQQQNHQPYGSPSSPPPASYTDPYGNNSGGGLNQTLL